MTRIILSIRNQCFYLLLAATVLVFALISTSGSSGISRNQGGDDEGSGIGGTGIRQLRQDLRQDFGESGFGGTGLKPYLGSIDDEVTPLSAEHAPFTPSIADNSPPSSWVSISAQSQLLPSPARVSGAYEIASNMFSSELSGEILITDAVQQVLDVNAVLIEEIKQSVVASKSESLASYLSLSETPTVTLASATQVQQQQSIDTESLTLISDVITNENETDAQSANWQQFTHFLAQEVDQVPDSRTNAQLSSTAGKATLIEVSSDSRELHQNVRTRIQRPELPPIQRIRPIERLTVLPPRIQPMRI